MDKSISYKDALGEVDASVVSFDTSKLWPILYRFPVLQVYAAQRLMDRLAVLKTNEAFASIVPITQVIGCIITPRYSLTAECRMCSIYLFYSIRDQDESILRAILKHMIVEKRSCEGCGLFVHTVSTESLKQCTTLARFIADNLNNKDEAQQYDTDTHFWMDAVGLLEREGFLKVVEPSPVSSLRNSSLLNNGARKLRRLRLRTNGRKKWRTMQPGNGRTSTNVRSCSLGSYKERITLLKLATMHTVCPDFVAEKLGGHGLKSFCATRIRVLCDSVSSTQRHALTLKNVQGLRSFANIMSDPLHLWTDSTYGKGLSNDVVLSLREGNDFFSVFNPWMPLELGIRSTIKSVLCGEVLMDTILDIWAAAKGNMRSSVDQMVVAVLSDGEAFRKLTKNHLRPRRTAASSSDSCSTVDTHVASPFCQINECLRCLEQAITHGFGYPLAFWDQTMQVFHGVTDVIIWVLLHENQGAWKQQVKDAVIRCRRIEKQLQNHVKYHPPEPNNNCAVLKVCDCSSVELTWKHLRRLRFDAWHECRCTNRNKLFVRVPNPSLCFSWARSVISEDSNSASNAENSDSSASAFLWLYGNPAWGDIQYNHSEREVLRCVIDNALRDGTGAVVRATKEILAHALRNPEVCENVLSDIAESASKLMCNSKHMFEPRTNCTRLRLLRKSIEELWASAYQQAKCFKLRHDSAMLTRTLPADTQGVERLLAMVAPCSSAVHDCIRDMPKLCEYIAITHRHLVTNEENSNEASMQVKLIARLLSPGIARQVPLNMDRSLQRESFFESVMRCFE